MIFFCFCRIFKFYCPLLSFALLKKHFLKVSSLFLQSCAFPGLQFTYAFKCPAFSFSVDIPLNQRSQILLSIFYQRAVLFFVDGDDDFICLLLLLGAQSSLHFWHDVCLTFQSSLDSRAGSAGVGCLLPYIHAS